MSITESRLTEVCSVAKHGPRALIRCFNRECKKKGINMNIKESDYDAELAKALAAEN